MQQPRRQARPGELGFTLVELLIVIVVLGILSGIVLFGVARFRGDANLAACKADLATVAIAADAYDAQTGGYPTGVAGLLSGQYLKSTPSGTYTFDGTAKTVTRSPACSDGTATSGGLTAASGSATPTPSAPARTGSFTGVNGYCVDLANNSGADGTSVQLAGCAAGNAGQQWTAPPSYPGVIKALDSCLDVQGGGRNNNTVVQLYGCNNTGAQVWRLQSDGTLLNPQSGR
ncbi:MAG TPA: ricin-type beta-trefoil lectin domain protein, partial [Mycobacteriales bacterium]|nr:ricin-type beta-trefoil lectin domain protein [Mycobacteriales bacterium]